MLFHRITGTVYDILVEHEPSGHGFGYRVVLPAEGFQPEFTVEPFGVGLTFARDGDWHTVTIGHERFRLLVAYHDACTEASDNLPDALIDAPRSFRVSFACVRDHPAVKTSGRAERHYTRRAPARALPAVSHGLGGRLARRDKAR